MAILNSLINNGVSRLLGKVYMGDLTVSGTATFTKTTDASATSNNSPALIIGGTATTAHIEIDNNGIIAKSNATTPTTLALNYGGGIVQLGKNGQVNVNDDTLTANEINVGTDGAYFSSNSSSTTIQNLIAGNSSLTNLSSDNIQTKNLNVTNLLRAAKYDLQTIGQLGGAWTVSPTIQFPSPTTTQLIVSAGADGYQLLLIITDSSLTSAEMSGITWTSNSKVKVSGTINGITTGTMDGVIEYVNTTSHSIKVNVSGGAASDVVIGASGVYNSPNLAFSDLNIVVYEIYNPQTSTYFPVGIFMNCYDDANNSSTIRVYGGTDQKPNVMVGNLTNSGLDAIVEGNSSTVPTGWGFYAANNAYIKGMIFSNTGVIGGWTISASGLRKGTLGQSEGIYLLPNGATQADSVAIGGSASRYDWAITSGNTFGITTAGEAFITNGKIGGWSISADSLSNGTFGSANSIFLIPAGSTTSKQIGGSDSISNWVISAGSNFGVTNDGTLYASNLQASGGTIGGIHIDDGKIYSGSHSTYNSANQGFYLGNDGKIGIGGSSKYLYWDGSNLDINGADITVSNTDTTTEISSIGFKCTRTDNQHYCYLGYYNGYTMTGMEDGYPFLAFKGTRDVEVGEYFHQNAIYEKGIIFHKRQKTSGGSSLVSSLLADGSYVKLGSNSKYMELNFQNNIINCSFNGAKISLDETSTLKIDNNSVPYVINTGLASPNSSSSTVTLWENSRYLLITFHNSTTTLCGIYLITTTTNSISYAKIVNASNITIESTGLGVRYKNTHASSTANSRMIYMG